MEAIGTCQLKINFH